MCFTDYFWLVSSFKINTHNTNQSLALAEKVAVIWEVEKGQQKIEIAKEFRISPNTLSTYRI